MFGKSNGTRHAHGHVCGGKVPPIGDTVDEEHGCDMCYFLEFFSSMQLRSQRQSGSCGLMIE